MNLRSSISIFLLAGLPAAVAPAQEAARRPPAPIFGVTPPTVESVIEERTYYYRKMAYAPPVEVQPVARADASYGTPEETAIALISAMLAGDLDWHRSVWTESSRRLMTERDRELGREPSFWPEQWRRGFAGKKVTLTHRIETGDYVLIVYHASPRDPRDAAPGEEWDLVAVLERQDDRWWVTQKLSGDPVVQYWNQPGHRIKTMARGIAI